MNKIYKTTKTARRAFAVVLLAGLLVPGNARAQLFGGTIKTSFRIPQNMILATNLIYKVASVRDQNYFPWTTPTAIASTDMNVNPDATDETLINVQGSIPTTGVTIYIPVTATGSGMLPAYSGSVAVDPTLTEDNLGGTLTFSWPMQTYTSSTKGINATLAAVGSTLYAKKLDINAGIGSDFQGILLGTINYPYNNAGNQTTLQVRDIALIPDRMYGIADNSGSTTSHLFLYIPVKDERGTIWLNNNLGADYANLNSPSFSPASQATSPTDYHAYGSLFQWGRKPDGHELILWSSSSTGSLVNGISSVKSDNPTHANYIDVNPEWRINSSDNLWQGGAAANNPCPTGFHVPSYAEFLTYAPANMPVSRTPYSLLKFSTSYYEYPANNIANSAPTYGFYLWTSSRFNPSDSYYLTSRLYYREQITPARAIYNYMNSTIVGLSVRCIKD